MKYDKMYGEFTTEQRKDLNKLLLKLQKINHGPIKNRMKVKVPLKQLTNKDENLRLWNYILHAINLFLCLPNRRRQIRIIADKNPHTSEAELLEEIPLDLIPFVYKYVWRKFKSCEKPECYIIMCARFAWINLFPSLDSGYKVPLSEYSNITEIDDENGTAIYGYKKNHKVCNINPK